MPDARTHHTATGPQTATAAVLGWFDAHDAVGIPAPGHTYGQGRRSMPPMNCSTAPGMLYCLPSPPLRRTRSPICRKAGSWRIVDDV